MSDKSSIEWTDATWNPLRGTKGRHHCVRVSEGCKHCYAATMNHRFKGPDYVKGADVPRLDEDALLQPLKWRKPRRIFVCSMTDLFMDEHTDEMIDQVFAVMTLADWHTYQILTKRSKRMREYVAGASRRRFSIVHDILPIVPKSSRACELVPLGELKQQGGWPLSNVWLGVSAENQERADERMPDLLATPAAVRFVSAEPLIGAVDLASYLLGSACPTCSKYGRNRVRDGKYCPACGSEPHGVDRIDWVIVGGESGSGARPCDVSWIRSVKDQCGAAGVPCFVKQLGARVFDSDYSTGVYAPYDKRTPTKPDGAGGMMAIGNLVLLKDRKGGNPSEWSPDLRVRQMPEVKQ